MNEVTRIHLGRQPFTIAVDAHKALQEYLQAIKKAVGKSHKEVVEEVELRMAELLIERGVTGDKAVLPEDIAYLKEQLGQPGDFSDDGATGGTAESEADAPEDEAERSPKRLFRDPQHGVIAGVASGLAAYVGINAWWVRLLFVVMTFLTSGVVLLIYIILWLAIPPARTQSERLQMQGKPVTVDSLKALVDQADFEGAATRASKTIEPVFTAVFKVFIAAIGVGFILAAIATWIGAIVAGSFLLITGLQIDGIDMFPVGIKEMLLVSCGLAVMLVVAAVLHIIGMSGIRYKWTAKGWLMGMLAGLFVLFCSLGTALAFSVGPGIEKRLDSVRQEKTLTQPEFTQLHVIGDSSYVTFEQSDRYAVEVRYMGSKDRDVSQLASVKDGQLTLDTKLFDNGKDCGFWCIDADNLEVKVFAPSLQMVRAENDASVSVDRLTVDNLTITTDSSSNVHLHGATVAKATIQDNRTDGSITVVAQGIRDKNNSFHESSVLSVVGHWIDLGDIAEVDLTTSTEGCAEGEYFVRAVQAPKMLRINGQQIDPLRPSEINGKEQLTPAHCFILEQQLLEQQR
jgi:phage shock protein PspC (stress-responsive transcriptional regulator)